MRNRIEAGMTWDAETDTWIRPEHAGAIVTKAPKGWKDLFGAPEKSRGLTVVMLAYDWKEANLELVENCYNCEVCGEDHPNRPGECNLSTD